MGEKYKRLKGLRKEVSFLKDELTTINAFLEKMDNVHELDSLAKNWRKHVIEMSYDIEDCIDNFIQHVAEADDNKVGILQKACQYVRTFNDHNRIANQIKQIKNHVIQESERRIRYKLDYCISNTTTVFIDPRLSALYKEASSLVGIDDQKEAIINWVMDHERQLKMASIVGSGGLGKTTLANVVYHEVRGQFNCKAFVSVSQKPDMMRVLNSAILQVGQPEFFNACEIQDLINILREYLQDKR
ncbi:hypothetical protein PR202_gb03299 [Eleusine coracana subsp. coracana]|uniref:Uncharacterized protein n=1 Tax=Eleusine coracana subsp. coracana TaxID=191504 RepID=A0AAV5E0L0_ELECO|nr:hypothetical protein PR202_gb03219 [Eleusine coracana subsp. coracana]GJN16323.1 hypothetical protein PR202_gb03299 [Eleusine coracana subsp. coracana]